MEICKAPTLRFKALNKHTHLMYIQMENVIKSEISKCYHKRNSVSNKNALFSRASLHDAEWQRQRVRAKQAHSDFQANTKLLPD